MRRIAALRATSVGLLAAFSLAALALVACSGGRTPGAPAAGTPSRSEGPSPAASVTATTPAGPSATASPAAGPPATATRVEPRPVALAPISDRVWARPTEVGVYPSAAGGAPGLFVAEQDGVLYQVAADGQVSPILDLRDRVLRSGNEEGLLSVALDPAFAANRHVWVYYSAGSPRRTVLARFTREAGGPAIDRGSQLVVLEVGQPFANHNGGAIRFGPDGMLYLGLGDGGSQGDPSGNGQNLGVLLGKIIRIDVRNASTERPYAIPGDNPFAGRSGARGEIWAYGLRNPWRMAFDPATRALWVGDVGQGQVEEVDVVARGANYGWSVVEGDRCHRPAANCDRSGLTPPVVTYTHSGGRCSIAGGLVYRGTRVPEIAGAYVYGDTCSGEVWAVSAHEPGDPVRIATDVRTLSSFGVDPDGEILLLTFAQPIRRIVPRP